MTYLPWVSTAISIASVAVALFALRTNGKRELRSFNRKLLTEHVTEVLVLVDTELARLGAGSTSANGFDVSGVRYMELQYQLLGHKTVIEVVSPSCARAVEQSVERMTKFRKEAGGEPYPMLGAMLNGLALLRGQVLATHLRAVSHPKFDEKEIKQRARKLKGPVEGTTLQRIVGPET